MKLELYDYRSEQKPEPLPQVESEVAKSFYL